MSFGSHAPALLFGGALASGLACQDADPLWIPPPAAPPSARTVFFVASQGTSSAVELRRLPREDALHLPLEIDTGEPAFLQAVFTPYALSQLDLAEGPFLEPDDPTTSLGSLDHEAQSVSIEGGTVGAWSPSPIDAPARTLGLRPQLCPELEFEQQPHEARVAVPFDEGRAALLTPNEVIWYEWRNQGLETRKAMVPNVGLLGYVGRFEDENTLWLGGPELHRVRLDPPSLTTYASFGQFLVRDIHIERGGQDPRVLVITNEGRLFAVETSTVTDLAFIPGDRGGIAAAGFAVAAREGRVYATAAGASSVYAYSSAGIEVEQLSVIDNEGLAFGATLRSLGPILVSRPLGDVYLRVNDQQWVPTFRLNASVRRGSDFGTGVLFFDSGGEIAQVQADAGACPSERGPWADSAHGAPLGPHVLVAAEDTGDTFTSWIVRVREPE